MIMRTLFGAIAGALAIVAMLVSYNLGERHAVTQGMAPTTQMVVGPDGVARPYLVQAGQSVYGQTPFMAQPGAWPYAATMTPGAVAPMAAYNAYGAQPQYVNERVVYSQPAVRRVTSQRAYATERVASQRSWQKSALLIGGSAASGAGVGAIVGGKKGAGIGALIGGGAATLFDQIKRR
jgi:hypothetical protein